MDEASYQQESNEELYEHHRFDIEKGQNPLRIDKFLVNRLENASRNKIQAAAEAGNILVNNHTVKSNYKVKPGDVVSIVMTYPPREIEIIPENIPLDILYEDDEVIVVNKKASMVVHPGYGNYSGTLVNALAYHLSDLPGFSKGDIRAGMVHRLDKDTSGVLVIAKTEYALNHLAKQFFYRTTSRKYIALVWGIPDPEEGCIEGHIGRSQKDRKRMAVYVSGDRGKHAITHYRVLEPLSYVSKVECRLETGRTHQIRAHFAHIKHPLFNDEKYGGNKILKGTTFTKYKQFVENCFKILPRQALHAVSLGFEHPRTGKDMYFETDLPEDIKQAIEKWRKYISGRDEQ